MIEMKMCVDDYRYVFRCNAGDGLQRLVEGASTVNAVHRSMLFAPFFSDTGVDQNSFIIGLDEKTVHVHANTILIVRRMNA